MSRRRSYGSVLRRGRFWGRRRGIGFRRARPAVIAMGGRRRMRSYYRNWMANSRYQMVRYGRLRYR